MKINTSRDVHQILLFLGVAFRYFDLALALISSLFLHSSFYKARRRERAPSECIGVCSALSARSLLGSQSLHATMNILCPRLGDYKNMYAHATRGDRSSWRAFKWSPAKVFRSQTNTPSPHRSKDGARAAALAVQSFGRRGWGAVYWWKNMPVCRTKTTTHFCRNAQNMRDHFTAMLGFFFFVVWSVKEADKLFYYAPLLYWGGPWSSPFPIGLISTLWYDLFPIYLYFT